MNREQTIPVIRLEVERMRHTLYTMLCEHTAAIDESLRRAVDDYCRSENIDAVVRQTASEVINDAVKQEIRDFFRYSAPGRLAVKEAVNQYLTEWEAEYSHRESLRKGQV